MSNSIAGLTTALNSGLANLSALGVNVGGGGGTAAAPATGGAGTPAGTGSATAQPVSTPLPAVNAAGRAFTVVKDNANDKYTLQPPSGVDEKVVFNEPDGKRRTLVFDGQGKQINNFDIAARENRSIDLDRRQGIASGIDNLSKIVAGRQERLKKLQEALAQDSDETGSTNQLHIQRIVTEQQVTEHLSNMNHKIYESVQNAISPWLR